MKDYKKIQAKFKQLAKPKFHVKGEEVEGVLNEQGHHMVFVKKKPKMVNRSEAHRRAYPITDETGKRLTAKGAKHIVKPHEHKLDHDPRLTNKMRFNLRKEARNATRPESRAPTASQAGRD